jgi:predicted alpha/beta hydrolase family esterase
VLRVLEKTNVKVKAAFLVAGFLRGLNNDEVDEINATFYDKPFDWEKIKANCGEFYCFASDNDPYVPVPQAKEVADGVGVELIMVKGAGHFNAKAGYTKFDLLLDKIKGAT